MDNLKIATLLLAMVLEPRWTDLVFRHSYRLTLRQYATLSSRLKRAYGLAPVSGALS
jgi:hypothetical protein